MRTMLLVAFLLTESSYTGPISKVECLITDRFYTTLWCRVNWYSDSSRSEKIGARAGNHGDVSTIRNEEGEMSSPNHTQQVALAQCSMCGNDLSKFCTTAAVMSIQKAIHRVVIKSHGPGISPSC